jgi:hypothetical protein
VSKRRERSTTGDGDSCPLNPEHGRMCFLNDSGNQWCPSVDHDGRPKSHPAGKAGMTRSFWPKGDDALRRAVIQTTLPEIDIALIGG